MTLNVEQTDLTQISAVLMAPDGQTATLFVSKSQQPQGSPLGLSGNNLGITTTGFDLGTTFDDNAARRIDDASVAAPYVGTFQPEGSLGIFDGEDAATLSGQWKLLITSYVNSANVNSVVNWSIKFTSGMTEAYSQSTVATTLVKGSQTGNFPTAAPSTPNGIGPGIVLAEDNTLGASPYQGRIYAAYVGYVDDSDPNGHVNPTTNTDIFLSYSDDGGRDWHSLGIVNDDDAITDGYSGSGGVGNFAYTSGRTQFQPEIAVDQATGTLVISWRDARDDAANARVATYLTSSIDGGQSFSPQTYANPSQTAVDAITGQTDILGPESDNESAGNPQIDKTYGYGDQMGLAVFDGQVYPIWAGNFNRSTDPLGTVIADPLNIWYRPMVIAAGPRIIDSTMGPISLAEAASGSVSISVTFDRPVTSSTFVLGDVQVFFRGTTDGTASVPLTVTGVNPVAGTGSEATQFTVTFDPLPAGANPATYNYTGTYSYLIAPDNGHGLAISSPIETYIGKTLRTFDPMDQNADGTSDENAVTTAFKGTTPGDVYAVPMPDPTTAVQFLGAASILSPPFDQTTLPLIVPGPQVLSTSVPGGDSGAGNLVTDGTVSSLNVTFDRPMQVSSFTPGEVGPIMGPAGLVSGPQYFPLTTSTGQVIPAAANATNPGTLDSTLTIPSYDGTFQIAQITLELNAAFSPDSDLSAVLIAPDQTQVTLFSGVGGNKSNFINTIFDDGADSSIDAGTAPFTGTYQPATPLSTLDGHTVDMQNPADLSQWLPGVWTLQLTNSSTTATGMLDNWSLNITPMITVTPVNPSGGLATTFQIGFPLQQLSGTYTLQLGPNILDAFGDALDINQNAGLAVLRGLDQNGPTTAVTYTPTDVPAAIPCRPRRPRAR